MIQVVSVQIGWRVIWQVGDRELHLAARENDTEVIQRLGSAGADTNIRDTVSIRLLVHCRRHLLPTRGPANLHFFLILCLRYPYFDAYNKSNRCQTKNI